MVRYCFDTSAVNRLLDDEAREALVTGLLAGGSFRITAYNVIEAAKTTDVDRRRSLLRLLRRLCDGKQPLDRPNTLIRAAARGFATRFEVNAGSVTINADENLAGLWVALNEPELVDDDARLEVMEWAKGWEGDYDGIVSRGRERFQELLRRQPGAGPVTTAATFRSFLRNRDQIRDVLISPIYEQETGKVLTADEFEDLIVETMWALYLGGYAYATHQRAVKRNGYSRKRNAGAIDLGQAVYLRLCDCFLTNDEAQYRALRFLNRFIRPPRPQVLRYETFRKQILLPSFASG